MARKAKPRTYHQTLPVIRIDSGKFLSSWGSENILRFLDLPRRDILIHLVGLLGSL